LLSNEDIKIEYAGNEIFNYSVNDNEIENINNYWNDCFLTIPKEYINTSEENTITIKNRSNYS